jgi:hypothetical protein
MIAPNSGPAQDSVSAQNSVPAQNGGPAPNSVPAPNSGAAGTIGEPCRAGPTVAMRQPRKPLELPANREHKQEFGRVKTVSISLITSSAVALPAASAHPEGLRDTNAKHRFRRGLFQQLPRRRARNNALALRKNH